jgi:15-cis-phytoene synthase
MRARASSLEEPYRGRAVPPASPRYFSWLFAAPEARDPLLGVYALMAEWRSLMEPAAEASAARLKIAWWQEEIARLARRTPVHPITRFLGALPGAERVDFAPLGTSIEAVARQIAGAPLEHGSELAAHSTALRAVPLEIAARLASAPAPDIRGEGAAERATAALAEADYLAEALADYRRAAQCGRVVFPIDELLAARIEDADLTAGEPPAPLQAYLDGLRRHAAELYAAADSLPHAERPGLRHLLVLAALGAKRLRERGVGAGGPRLFDLYLAWTTARRAVRDGSPVAED